MHTLITDNKKIISKLCEKHHVKSLYVFGSAAREIDFTDNSDVDFLVNFQFLPTITNDEVFYKVDNSESLLKKLESVINRKIDLIEEKNIKNKFLRYFINKEKKLIYGLS